MKKKNNFHNRFRIVWGYLIYTFLFYLSKLYQFDRKNRNYTLYNLQSSGQCGRKQNIVNNFNAKNFLTRVRTPLSVGPVNLGSVTGTLHSKRNYLESFPRMKYINQLITKGYLSASEEKKYKQLCDKTSMNGRAPCKVHLN